MSKYNLPSIESYGQYSSDNYGAHTLRVIMPNLTLYFSYETVVAFRCAKYGRVVCQNDWGVTTGKHLNWIDGGDKKSRVPRDQFEKMLAEVLEENNVSKA